MPDTNLAQPPVGYLWAEDLSRTARKDLNTIVWLCEQRLIDSKKFEGRWGVRIVRSASAQAGSVLVHDLKAGRDITIGSIIGQYVTLNGKDPQADKDEWIAQTPIRQKVEVARRTVRWTWYILGGGALFFLVGIVISWVVAALMIIPALYQAAQAVRMAEVHGDGALLDEAKTVWSQAFWSAVLLWGVIIGFGLVILIVAVQG